MCQNLCVRNEMMCPKSQVSVEYLKAAVRKQDIRSFLMDDCHIEDEAFDQNQSRDDTYNQEATIIRRSSPFYTYFHSIISKVIAKYEKSGKDTTENSYYQRRYLDMILTNFMAFPLWIGLLLGNLNRYVR